MAAPDDDQTDFDATAEQLAELRRLGIAEVELQGLTSADAEEWIDELRIERIKAGRFGSPAHAHTSAQASIARVPNAVNSIFPDEFVQRIRQSDKPAADLLDVRTPAEYEQVHAEGAQLVPLDRLDPRAIMKARNGASDQPLYLICRSGSRAMKACEKFAAAGFHNVLCIEGGTEAWERAGLPVVRGRSKVISLERQVRIVAGSLVLMGAALGALVHPAFFGLTAFVGGGLVFAGLTDWCGMAMLLAKMPWNQGGASRSECSK